jgi:hypothetical protein
MMKKEIQIKDPIAVTFSARKQMPFSGVLALLNQQVQA